MNLIKFYNSNNYIKILLTFISVIASIFTIVFITVFSLGFFIFGPMEDIEQERYRKENHYLSHNHQMNQMDSIIKELKKLKEK
jgi:hypothetical protein